MADQSGKFNRKHTHKTEQKPTAKRQKRKKCVESIIDEAAIDAATPITCMCNELIDRIFDFLDVKSLLNVASTCKHLQIAAKAKFDQKFGKKRVCLIQDTKLPQAIHEYRDDIAVFGLKYTLQFLRCFGAEVTNLKLSCLRTTASKCEMHLYRYIQQYCADILTTLHFEMAYEKDGIFPVRLFTNSKPFKSVEKISLFGGHSGNQLSNFANWFPNLRYLDMFAMDTVDGSATGVSCPHLEHLSVELTKSSKNFSSRSVTKLLHANPQLKSLKINLHCTKDFGPLTKMLDKNTSISKLEIIGSVKGVNAAVLNQLTKMHPLLMELALAVDKTNVGDAVLLSHELKSLASLTFLLFGPYRCDHFLSQLNSQWQHNISQEKHFTKIVLSH